jgi:hypothetical protein
MPLIQCVYCDNVYDPLRTRGSCNSCGREHPPGTRQIVVPLPPGTPAGPGRRIDANELKVRQQAATALFSAAVLQLICGGSVIGLFGLLGQGADKDNLTLTIMVTVVLAVSGVFILLGLWARFEPLTPSLLGLALYTVLCVLEICTGAFGHGGQAEFCCGVVVMNLAVYVGLVRAVIAAVGATQAPRREE